MRKFEQILDRFIDWRLKYIPENTFIIILSFLIGIVTGTAAVLLKSVIHFSINFFEEQFYNFGAYEYLLMPILGIVATFIFVKYFIKDDISHGVTRVLYSISKKNSILKPHNMWSSMIASTITISFGGSVGAEAPVVLTGASIGSNMARTFRLNYRQITLLVGCGAAGAISGIFKAPMTGVLFVLEVLMLELSMSLLIPLLISAVSAAIIAYSFMGDTFVISIKSIQSFDINNIGYYIVLGILCGLVALYFTRVALKTESFFKRIKKDSKRIITGVAVLTILVFVFPTLWGEGYKTIGLILNGNGSQLFQNSAFHTLTTSDIGFIGLVVCIILFKVIAMAATNGSGGVGGIFAPTLFVGSLVGFLLTIVMSNYFSRQLPESNFVLAGMAGLMSGVMHSPLTAIFLIAEVTGGYDLFIPLILTSVVAYITIMIFEPHSLYTIRLAQRGELMTHNKDKTVLMMLDLQSIIETDLVEVDEHISLRQLVAIISKSKRNIFPVVNKDQVLRGVVLLDNIRNIMFNQEMYDKTYVRDLMITPPAMVTLTDSMETIMEKFKTSGAWNLPVTENGKYIGFLSKSRIFNAYREKLLHFSHE